MIGPPPDGLTDSEICRLEIVGLPGPEDIEADAVYRFADTGEFVVEGEEAAAEVRKAFPSASIRVIPRQAPAAPAQRAKLCASWEE
jgi:hypothetical protein